MAAYQVHVNRNSELAIKLNCQWNIIICYSWKATNTTADWTSTSSSLTSQKPNSTNGRCTPKMNPNASLKYWLLPETVERLTYQATGYMYSHHRCTSLYWTFPTCRAILYTMHTVHVRYTCTCRTYGTKCHVSYDVVSNHCNSVCFMLHCGATQSCKILPLF